MKDTIIKLEKEFYDYHCDFNNDGAKCHDFAIYHTTTQTFESHGFHTVQFHELMNEDDIEELVQDWINSEEGQDARYDFILTQIDEDKHEEVDNYYGYKY